MDGLLILSVFNRASEVISLLSSLLYLSLSLSVKDKNRKIQLSIVFINAFASCSFFFFLCFRFFPLISHSLFFGTVTGKTFQDVQFRKRTMQKFYKMKHKVIYNSLLSHFRGEIKS